MGFPFLRWQNHVHAPSARNQDHCQHTGTVNDICFAADDSVVASCGRDCTIRLWEPLTMTPLACLKGQCLVYLKTYR
jgi:WD40 repeat protein